MIDEILAIYAIIDDLLKAIGHPEDCRRNLSDAEVITMAIAAALFFAGNHESARKYMHRARLDAQDAGEISV